MSQDTKALVNEDVLNALRPFPPRAAMALRDVESLKFWDGKVASFGTDEAFVDWLAESRKLLSDRASETPDFDELAQYPAVWARIQKIRARAPLKRFRGLLVRLPRGRPRKPTERQYTTAKQDQGELTRWIREARDEDGSEVHYLAAYINATYPDRTPLALKALVEKCLDRNVRASQVAAKIVGDRHEIAPRRVRAGRAPKTPKARRTMIRYTDNHGEG